MAVSLTNNFFTQARGLTFKNSTSLTWSLNANSNELSATVLSSSAASSLAGGAAGSLPYQSAPNTTAFQAIGSTGQFLRVSGGVPSWTTFAVASPSALTGLAAINGSTGNWMDAGSAPALNQAISPTMTGNWVFAPSSFTPVYIVGTAGNAAGIEIAGNGLTPGATSLFVGQDSSGNAYLYQRNNASLFIGTNSATRITVSATGAVSVAGSLGVNGAAPPAKVTGWGTPTGQTVVANFAAGASPSLLQMSEAVAQIITDLKAFGIYGA